MIKNYTTIFLLVSLGACSILSTNLGIAQELKVFKVSDFDLEGQVKSCLVITDYGKEEYNFNEAGFLTKSVTRFSDSDYEITQYKYAGKELIEKRIEHYRDNVFDNQTSMAYLYTIDTLANRRVTEQIISYNKAFSEQYEYLYNETKQLIKIKKTNDEGIDETTIEYSFYKGESTVEYLLNGELLKSIRTSKKKTKLGTTKKTVLTKSFLQGAPQKAIEEVFDENNKLISKLNYVYSTVKKQFELKDTQTYKYTNRGVLTAVTTTREKATGVQNYSYQYDNGDTGNWIKEIISPDNTYTTRKIKYFEASTEVEE